MLIIYIIGESWPSRNPLRTRPRSETGGTSGLRPGSTQTLRLSKQSITFPFPSPRFRAPDQAARNLVQHCVSSPEAANVGGDQLALTDSDPDHSGAEAKVPLAKRIPGCDARSVGHAMTTPAAVEKRARHAL